jgi:hypothetical protein
MSKRAATANLPGLDGLERAGLFPPISLTVSVSVAATVQATDQFIGQEPDIVAESGQQLRRRLVSLAKAPGGAVAPLSNFGNPWINQLAHSRMRGFSREGAGRSGSSRNSATRKRV